MPSRLTTPTTLESGFCPSGVDWGSRHWIAPTTSPRSTFSFGARRMLHLSERALQVANSPSTPAEVFCIQGGAFSATYTRPLETLRPRCPPNPYTPPQPSTDTHAGLRPTQDLGVPLPDPAKGPLPAPEKHTHPPAAVSQTPPKPERVPGPAVLGSQKGRARSPPAPNASLSTRSGCFSLSQEREGGEVWEGRGKARSRRGGRSRTGTTSTGPTLGLALSTRVLWIGQTYSKQREMDTTTSGSSPLLPLLSNRVGLLSGSAFKDNHPHFFWDYQEVAACAPLWQHPITFYT